MHGISGNDLAVRRRARGTHRNFLFEYVDEFCDFHGLLERFDRTNFRLCRSCTDENALANFAKIDAAARKGAEY